MGGNCVCIDVDDPATILADRVVKARKQHRCCECGETIALGRLHSVEDTVFEGQFVQYRTCARCRNIRDEYFSCGWYWGGLAEDFLNAFGFDYLNGIPPDFAPCNPSRIDTLDSPEGIRR